MVNLLIQNQLDACIYTTNLKIKKKSSMHYSMLNLKILEIWYPQTRYIVILMCAEIYALATFGLRENFSDIGS